MLASNFYANIAGILESIIYYSTVSPRKRTHILLGSVCRQCLLCDCLPGCNSEDVFMFSVRSNETTAGCALSFSIPLLSIVTEIKF